MLATDLSSLVGLGTEEGALPPVELGVGVWGATGCWTAERSHLVTSSGLPSELGSRQIELGLTTNAIPESHVWHGTCHTPDHCRVRNARSVYANHASNQFSAERFRIRRRMVRS